MAGTFLIITEILVTPAFTQVHRVGIDTDLAIQTIIIFEFFNIMGLIKFGRALFSSGRISCHNFII